MNRGSRDPSLPMAKEATANLRASDAMVWQAVRNQLEREGIAAEDAAVATYFQGSPGHDGYVLARNGRYFLFTVLDPIGPGLAPDDLLHTWEELDAEAAVKRGSHRVLVARVILDEDRSID